MNKTQLIKLGLPLLLSLVRNPKQLVIGLIALTSLSGLWYWYEIKIARPGMVYMGIPKMEKSHEQSGFTHILRKQAFMVNYSEGLKNPLWVSYQITQNTTKYGKRPPFKADWRTLSSVTSDDYKGSGYDRGHMAPNYVIASRYGRSAQQETFLMTNITPQRGNLNQKSWQRLEEVAANDFSALFDNIWVYTGPIFSKQPKTLKSASVSIPKAFYKIYLALNPETQKPHVLAFIFPQNARKNASLKRFVTNVDEIEKKTGFDFFWQLPDEVEIQLEKSRNDAIWQLDKVANRPSRY